MTRRMHRLGVGFVVAATIAASSAHAAPINCTQVFSGGRTESMKANLADVEACIKRGYGPPKKWKVNGGKNSGTNASGSGGFSVGTIPAPEDAPRTRNVRASASGNAMKSACTFPPRVKISLSGISFPAGDCLDFFNRLFKDKNGSSSDGGGSAGATDESCPAFTDNASSYGQKIPLQQGPLTMGCGGTIGLTSIPITLNPDPVGFLSTEEGSYNVWVYRKSGNGYVAVGQHRLPTYLCMPVQMESGIVMKKTVDLTPPEAQILTYSAGTASIQLKLQNRGTMDMSFIPPYDEDEPEHYLTFPINPVSGVADVPADCALETDHYQPLQMRQDIVIKPVNGDTCESAPTMSPTAVNNFEMRCPTGATQNPDGSCIDSMGRAVPKVAVNHWQMECPVGDTNGSTCSLMAGIPSEAACNSQTAEEASSITCELSVIHPTAPACQNMVQQTTLDRPTLYSPAGNMQEVNTVEGRSAFMLKSSPGSQVYTQPQTTLAIGAQAQPVLFPEGGLVRFKDGSQMLMDAQSTLSATMAKIDLPNGGELVALGGTLLRSYPPGSTYTFPSAEFPVEAHTNRSVLFPAASYGLLTAPTIGRDVPYVRAPLTQVTE